MAEVVVVPAAEIDDHLRVLMLSNEGVGKTALIKQYSGGVQREDEDGVEFTKIEVVHGRRIAVHIMDGYECAFPDNYGIIVVFDVTNRASFERFTIFFQDDDACLKMKVVIGNKTDLNGQRVVSKEEAEQFARKHNLVYLETSATDPDSTRAAFRRAIEVLVGGTAMHEVAWNGNVSKIEEAFGTLGEQFIDTPDNEGRTPLHHAAGNGNVQAIELLVRLGSKAIDTPDWRGRTPLHYAAENGEVAAIEALVRLGSKAIDALTNRGSTPLHAAAEDGIAPVIKAALPCLQQPRTAMFR